MNRRLSECSITLATVPFRISRLLRLIRVCAKPNRARRFVVFQMTYGPATGRDRSRAEEFLGIHFEHDKDVRLGTRCRHPDHAA